MKFLSDDRKKIKTKKARKTYCNVKKNPIGTLKMSLNKYVF